MRKINYFALMMLLVSFQLIGFAATPIHVTLSNGANCVLSGNVFMVVSGNLNNSGTFTYKTGTPTAKFTNTTGQQLIGGTGETKFQKAEFDNPSNFKLQGSVSADGAITLTNGTVDIDNYNLTMGTDANFQGTFGTTKMVIADKTAGKTGQVMKMYKTGSTNFVFPIGDATVTIDYSPVTLNFTANSDARTIGLNVVDTRHPNDFSANYISRYWNFSNDPCSGTYTYDATFGYSANSPTDLVGTYNTVDVFWWNGSWNELPTTYPGVPNYSVSGANENTGNLCATQYTGRTCPLAVLTPIPDQTVCEFLPITFTAVAAGSELSYQWVKDGNNIWNATKSIYAISKASVSDGAVYTCKVSNSCGTDQLPDFTLTVNRPIASNTIYTKIIKENGEDGVTLTATISRGTPPLFYQWYQQGQPLTDATNSTYITNSPITPADSGLYTCKITNMCNTITPKIAEIFVRINRFEFFISGNVKYEDSLVMSSKTTLTNVTLLTSNDIPIETTNTDDNGYYVFAHLPNADYKLVATTNKKWGGVNPVDALLINRNYIGLFDIIGPPSMKKIAADVNKDTKIMPNDALLINRRYIGLLSQFVDKDKNVLPDWLFNNPSVTVASASVTKNILALCMGDVNASYKTIPAKNIYTPVNNAGLLKINAGEEFDLPVYINDINEIGALGLKLKGLSGLKITGLNSETKDMIYNITCNGINIAWSASNEGMNITPDKPVFILKAVYNGQQNPEGLQLSNESVIADINVNSISNDNVFMPKLVLSNTTPSDFSLFNYPNPFSNLTNIEYVIPEDANVKLVVYNVLGEKISTLADQRQTAGKYTVHLDGSTWKQGVYYCKIEAVNASSTYTMTNIMMIAR